MTVSSDNAAPDGTDLPRDRTGADGDPTGPGGRGGPAALDERYASLDVGTRGLVIYDRDETRAWIQSTDPVALADAGEPPGARVDGAPETPATDSGDPDAGTDA